MVSTAGSKYATKLVREDITVQTVGEAKEKYTNLLGNKPHQFSILPKVTTKEQASQRANYFSEADGHYPRGMSVCYTVGLSGDCGFDCPDFTAGICEVGEEMCEKVIFSGDMCEEDIDLFELYIGFSELT